MKKVKNTKQSSDTWCGQTIASSAYYELNSSEYSKWANDSKVLTDIGNGNLLVNNGSADISDVALAINFMKDISPQDTSGRPITRFAATIEGWHYQLLATEITTSKYGGFFSKNEDGNDLSFVTHKLYDSNGDEIVSAQNEGNAVKTCVWVRPNHSYESIGAIFMQKDPPTTDIRLWVTGLPGIYNIRFAQGGINLKYAGSGGYQLADGRASKYLAYNAQSSDANSFKFTLKHDQGVQHTFQVILEIYKAP